MAARIALFIWMRAGQRSIMRRAPPIRQIPPRFLKSGERALLEFLNTRGVPTMTTRRYLLLMACALLGVVFLSAPLRADAQGYPARPVKLVVPFPPGGSLDIAGRLIAQRLSETWGQAVVVENKPGAGGNIGADLVAKSAPDGYTILLGALSTHAVNPSLYANMPYDPVKDFVPITLLATTPNVLVVNPTLPVSSVRELVAYAK